MRQLYLTAAAALCIVVSAAAEESEQKEHTIVRDEVDQIVVFTNGNTRILQFVKNEVVLTYVQKWLPCEWRVEKDGFTVCFREYSYDADDGHTWVNREVWAPTVSWWRVQGAMSIDVCLPAPRQGLAHFPGLTVPDELRQ